MLAGSEQVIYQMLTVKNGKAVSSSSLEVELKESQSTNNLSIIHNVNFACFAVCLLVWVLFPPVTPLCADVLASLLLK